MEIISSRRFALWWQLAMDWFRHLYDECSVEDVERMFETTTEDGLIIVPSGLVTPEGTMPISVFKAITGLTPTE